MVQQYGLGYMTTSGWPMIKKIAAIYNMLENEIEQTNEWWKDKKTIEELDSRYKDLETGKDKGLTIEQIDQFVTQLRIKKYGK